MDVERAIERALMLYAWGYDSNDMGMVEQAFTPDAELIFAPDEMIEDVEALGGERRTVGRDAILEQFRASRAGFAERGEQPWHLISNMLIESQSATQAHVRCCYLFATQTVDGLTVHGLSRYFDHFTGSASGWHIRTRRNVVAHLGSRRSAEHR
jgi:hypothetical protein